jgi:hypothetical protein
VNPDLLALQALGEPVGSPEDHDHLSGCVFCQHELEAFSDAVAVGRSITDDDALIAPPPQVWQRISAELQLGAPAVAANGHAVPTASEAVTEVTPPAAAAAPVREAVSSSRGLRAASLALAAVLALVVGIGLGANLDRLLPGQREVTSVQLNALPPWPGSSGRAVVEQDRDGNRFLVVDISSPEPATGPREVWLTNTAAEPMYAVGFLKDNKGRFPLPPEVDVSKYNLVDISQEPSDDPDPGHSGDSMLRGKLPV